MLVFKCQKTICRFRGRPAITHNGFGLGEVAEPEAK